MSEKQTKKLKAMAKMFYRLQPPNMPKKKSFKQVFQDLKNIHKNKNNETIGFGR